MPTRSSWWTVVFLLVVLTRWRSLPDSRIGYRHSPVGMRGFEPPTSCSQSKRADLAAPHPDSVVLQPLPEVSPTLRQSQLIFDPKIPDRRTSFTRVQLKTTLSNQYREFDHLPTPAVSPARSLEVVHLLQSASTRGTTICLPHNEAARDADELDSWPGPHLSPPRSTTLGVLDSNQHLPSSEPGVLPLDELPMILT